MKSTGHSPPDAVSLSGNDRVVVPHEGRLLKRGGGQERHRCAAAPFSGASDRSHDSQDSPPASSQRTLTSFRSQSFAEWPSDDV